jgi:hypothetical protein
LRAKQSSRRGRETAFIDCGNEGSYTDSASE